MLPGHYALLPGGYKVTVAASQVAPPMLHTSALPGGAYMVSGYRANANTGQRDQLGSQFLVTPGDVVRKLSQYDETTISEFFQKQAAAQNLAPPALAQDAGRLVIRVTSALIFQGRGDFSVGVGGRGGQADIVGTNLAVIGDGDVAPTGFVGLTEFVAERDRCPEPADRRLAQHAVQQPKSDHHHAIGCGGRDRRPRQARRAGNHAGGFGHDHA